ncbi:bifunctional 4-hydroxy-3-methylbut-2-enyl diphosphate reductase/30S ribosomal protein S1 [Halanaerobacter jeridensis]|uniref:4-hydroxy-3-methylbut-2-enyl diphosphate reductase n=1 Tax=Halanaerobacter jeridensis TaxID=706427 RepID=A0A938XRD2_9FIRM|nr:bifunctional 4-hydroxy-3-methylbut-2-enyl diphosphate reductase/30S ribosomal protein S1 [Halanaerobacter jeridensis]MBM7555993.1 4-hydroxy-3-methylbut-2-enyl diphosphate reductase [Halanaerobacter jeridensis]
MEILVGDYAGFCFGVDRAMEIAFEAGESKTDEVYTLGPLIHNPQAVGKLNKVGVGLAEDINDVEEGTIIIRSHGVAPEVIEKAEKKGLEVINATCPFVKKAQEKAKKLKEDGYQVLISGDKNHPEVAGILGFTNEQAIVIEDESDFSKVPNTDKIGVITQTTQSISHLQNLVNYLLPKVKDLKVHNTICTTTSQRQEEAAQLAEKVDLMIVLGGYNSANTNRLAEICCENGVNTHHVETAEELQTDWFTNIKKVGITAGASTPNWIIKEAVKRMEEINEEKNQVETTEGEEKTEELEQEENVTTAKDEEAVEETAEETQMEEEENFSATELNKGDVVKGTVSQISAQGVYVDVGAKTEGFVPADELTYSNSKPEEVVEEGEEIEVSVLNPEGEDGHAILSKKKVEQEQAWENIKEAKKNEEIIEAEVTKEVKGGLVVDVGLRGFVPASHVAIDYIEDLSQFVGETLKLKVIEAERENNNVVLSRKVLLEEEKEEKEEEILDSLEEDSVVEGTVTKLVDFGAFVDLGGIEGLLHISEISWGRIDHPEDVLEEGEEIEVKILGVDKDEKRISLGLKQIQPDPWEEFINEYEVGDVIEGNITKTVDFGAFMEVKPGVEGLIHISQLSHDHVETVEEVVTEGDEVEAKVININADDRKIGLSIKELESKPKSKNKSKTKKKDTKSQKPKKKKKEKEKGTKIGDLIGDELDELFD